VINASNPGKSELRVGRQKMALVSKILTDGVIQEEAQLQENLL
jgi:hypothetical protein